MVDVQKGHLSSPEIRERYDQRRRALNFLLQNKNPIILAVTLVTIIHIIAPLLNKQSQPEIKHDVSYTRMQQISRKKNSPRRWCMLTKENVPKHNKWFSTIEHFPHTLEWFADCWNYLQEGSNFEGADVKGGFIIDENVKKKLQKKYWNRAFFPGEYFPFIMSINSFFKF